MNVAEQLRILESARGDDALLALASVDIVYQGLSENERHRIKEALKASAIPHWCDPAFLSSLLEAEIEEATKLFSMLKSLTIVEPFPARGVAAVNVHETSRLALREYLRVTDETLWRDLSKRAHSFIGDNPEPHARIESLYHHFAFSQPTAALECERLSRHYGTLYDPAILHALSLSLTELVGAGWLTGHAKVEALLLPLDVRSDRGGVARLAFEAEGLLAYASEISHISAVGRVHCLLGDIRRAQGSLDKALASFLDALSISKNLIESDPANVGWLRDLSVAYMKNGDVLSEQGSLDEALIAFNEALTISLRLAERDPDDAGSQRELATGYSRIGDVQKQQGLLDEALASFRTGLTISLRLTERDPGNAGWQRELAASYSKIGDVRTQLDSLDEALAAYYESLEISKHLAENHSDDARWQRDLAAAFSKIGDVRSKQGSLDEALAPYHETLIISKRLAESDPENAGWQRDLAVALGKVGEIHLLQKSLHKALDAFRESLTICEKLTEKDLSNADWRRGLALAHHRLAAVFAAQREFGKVKSSIRWAIRHMNEAVAMAPGNPLWRRELIDIKRLL